MHTTLGIIKIKMNLNKIAELLLIAGGLNWGLVGLLQINVISTLLTAAWLQNLVYVLVGIAAILALLKK